MFYKQCVVSILSIFVCTVTCIADNTGRYQLHAIGDDRLVVIDTVSGQVWSKIKGRRAWIDEGNPVLETWTEKTVASLKMKSKVAELTIEQRKKKAIPGSDGSLFVALDDVTLNQVRVTIQNEKGDEVFLDDRSLEEGEVAEFAVSKKMYYLRVKELKNALIGDDFAIIEVTDNKSKLETKKPVERPNEKPEVEPPTPR